MIKVQVRLFGVFRRNRFNEAVQHLPHGSCVQDVVAGLGLSLHLLGIAVVNDRYAGLETTLEDGGDLALFPMLDGG